jgi:SNF2 family DNA or RNA helicase
LQTEEPEVPEHAAGAGPPSTAAPPVATKAEDEEANAQEAAELQARREHEAEILKQANEIRDRRAWLRVQPASDGKKGKLHWDHLLDEMVWLSKEFQRERRWKYQQARKVANQVARSNLDLESRVEVRAREAEKAIRKRASWIAREVSAFWNKAQRVVQFKVRTEVEAKKKEVLDRQLDVLLGQTQKYSSLLAQRLAVDERTEAVVAASKAEPTAAVPAKEQPTAPQAAARPRVPVSQPPSAAVSGTAPDVDDTRDYRSGEDDDADDEATLEEEERMAQEEGRNLQKDEKEEAAGLEEDADLPLEELLARYGYVVPGSGEAMDIDQAATAAAGPSTAAGAAAEDEGSDAESERLDALLRDPIGVSIPPPPSRLAAEFAELSDEEGAGSVDEDGAGTSRPAATRAMPRRGGGSATPSGAGPSNTKSKSTGPVASGSNAVDEDEYRSGEDDDADDEATLEEEERMAQAEGRNLQKDEKEEAAGLEEDADLPLEELLARYGYVVPGGAEPQAAAAAAGPSAGGAGPSGNENTRRQTRGAAAKETTTTAPAPIEEIEPEIAVQGTADDEEPIGLEGTMEAMAAAQPTGFTLDTTKVKTPVPFLLKGQLREYQHIGLDWLVTLYHRRLNGILADEMGLGKTIQTIALLAWLACERGDWGPHLVVVPTSVMLNWEMEFKRWCPAFKLLTYYGSPKERAAKRQGWSKPNAFHVCITSYTLVLQDARMFKRKKWKYLVLDEAHMIKNWRSQRWQTLLNFNSKRRLLITGTPLQNDLMELWSLMHFLMPQVFGSHAQFKDWFSNPLTGMVEGSAEYNKAIVERLHAVLRPFLLRRLKRDVEKQLPGKHEHVIKCRLSKRQRQLYEEYMASGDTRSTLSSGNFLGIMNCLMQLRKVCNHPDLFEGRAIVSAYDMPALELKMPSSAVKALTSSSNSGLGGGLGGNLNILTLSSSSPLEDVAINTIRWPQAGSLRELGLLPVVDGGEMQSWEVDEIKTLASHSDAFTTPLTTPQEDIALLMGDPATAGSLLAALRRTPSQSALAAIAASVQALATRRRTWRQERTAALGAMSINRTNRTPTITSDFLIAGHIELPVDHVHCIASQQGRHLDYSDTLLDMVKLPDRRAAEMDVELREFVFVIPKARAPPPTLWCSHPDSSTVAAAAHRSRELQTTYVQNSELLHIPRLRTQLFFPDKRLLQYDCGKLQELAVLLLKLKAQGSRALIFTQMSKMLDVLEAFLNLHAYTYVRLDGSTKPEQRQILMQRFNTDPKIFCFILSTRSGGVGMNLTGADTVIFYDSDWNPAMDAQAQDRCHRIGQTREVHIYRLVSEHTIEENILKKSDQKRQLDFLAIQSGGFTTDFLTSSKFDPQALLEGTAAAAGREAELQAAMRAAEDEGDAAAAAAAEQEVAAEMDEFIKEPPPQAAGGEDGGLNGGEGDGAAGPSNAAGDGAGAAAEGSDQPHTAAAAVAAEDDEGFADVAALAAGGAPGEDPLSHLQSALRPIEKYAVRFVEFEAPVVDAEALAAQMEATYKVEEFDVDAIEAAEEEREAEIDDDEEANLVGDWDQDKATAAYAAQVEEAEAEEREREAAEAAWIAAYEAQYGVLPPLFGGPEPSSAFGGGSGGGRKGGTGRGRGRPPAGGGSTGTGWMGDDAGGAHLDTAMSPNAVGAAAADAWGTAWGGGGGGKRRRVGGAAGPPPQPWEPQEDFVLSSVVALLLESGELPSPALWSVAADALGAGAAATSVTGVEAASRQGRRRTADACATRYRQLEAAYLAALGAGKENLEAGIARIKALIGAILGAAALPGHAADGLATAYAALLKLSATSPQANALLEQLHGLRGAAAAGGLVAPPPTVLPPGAPEAGPLEQAQAIAAAVRQGCGSGAARVISSRLPSVVQAAKVGSIHNAYGGGGVAVGALGDPTVGAPASDYGLDGLLTAGIVPPADGVAFQINQNQ